LRRLSMFDCPRVTDAGLAHLSSIKGLEWLDLGGFPEITGIGLESIEDTDNLRTLFFDFCDRLDDDGLRAIATRSKVEFLSVFGCDKITSAGMAELARMKSLNDFRVGGKMVDDEWLRHLPAMKGLKWLTIRWPEKITDEGLRKLLADCPNLKSLVMYGIRGGITEAGIDDLKKLRPDMRLSFEFAPPEND